MANTYTLIEAKTLSTSPSSLEFTTISQDYTDLLLLTSVRSTATANYDILNLRFNNDTGTNYSTPLIVYSFNGAAGSGGISAKDVINVGYINADSSTANTYSNNLLYIANYKSTDRPKVIETDSVMEANTANDVLNWLGTSYWNTTSAAITNIQFTINSGSNLKSGSTFYLYGISNS
jgi:hypothetical protein